MTKYLPIGLFLLSVVFLLPGLTQPLMSIEATVEKSDMLVMAADALTVPEQDNQFIQTMVQSFVHQLNIEGSVVVFKSTRSLLGTMSELISNGHVLVGVLIGLFAVVIPLFKIFLVSVSFFLKPSLIKRKLLVVSSFLSKWSMSDVFMMSLIVTFLAINANEHSINTVQMTATLGSGFYYFSAYCLLAIAAAQLMERQVSEV